MLKPCYYLSLLMFALSLMTILSQPSFAQAPPESGILVKQTEQFNAALSAANRGELVQAFQQWQRLQESGDLVPALQRAVDNNLAVVLMKQKQFTQAKKRLDLALKADPQVATTLDNLNQLYAYEAQQTYHKIFNQPPAKKPKGQWLDFNLEDTNSFAD